MADDLQQQFDMTRALERATLLRQQADEAWRQAIAEAYAADVPHSSIIKAAGISDTLEVQEIIRRLEEQGGT